MAPRSGVRGPGSGGRGGKGVALDGRYARQLGVPGIGAAGQARLAAARAVVLGAGGLGFPVLTYLGAAGVGGVAIVDRDLVEASNLNRQCLFGEADMGRPKATIAAARLTSMNPEVTWTAVPEAITAEVAGRLLAGAAVTLDCADNHEARRLLARAARDAGVPLIHGAVAGFEGQLAVFAAGGRPCFACLYPDPPAQAPAPPVLGAVAGALGSLMASEAIRLILGSGADRCGLLLAADLERGTFDWLRIPARADCPWCSR